MIVSFIEGRIRLRNPLLRDANILQQITSLVQNQPGIRQIITNERTGSLLIEYDSTIISHEDLLAARQMFEAFLPQEETTEESQDIMDEDEAQVVQKLQHILSQFQGAFKNDSGVLAVMLLTSALSGYLGFKKWHTVIASGFVAFAARHFMNRRTWGNTNRISKGQ